MATCKHGLTDDVELTLRLVMEDFVMGTKSTTLSYYCKEHHRHGQVRLMERASKQIDLAKFLPAET